MDATILKGSRIEMVTVASCPADFNGDASVSSQDFFDSLAAFFTGC